MNNIDMFNKEDLLEALECRGLCPCIIYNKLVIFRGEKIVFAKEINDLFINDLVDLGINVCDSRYINYLIEIAKEGPYSKRKSLTL